ncbi:MAG: phosphopantothenoylcysteine decarboxylase [Verrucomicrobiota bacterium]|nr:phosphopantothenoylcysteine decarboxylase [Verrucomicrobiota bacterium]
MKILITAGPTREFLDPVRFFSNRSTGKMGYAIAEAAIAAGIETKLISGPVSLSIPKKCNVEQILSAKDMLFAVLRNFPDYDGLIMTAAVADYRPVIQEKEKIKKKGKELLLKMKRTKDILSEVIKIKKERQFIMGFSAETESVIENSQKKLLQKKLDWIVVNDVSRKDIGFESDCNEVTVLSKEKMQTIPIMTKKKLAKELIKLILDPQK